LLNGKYPATIQREQSIKNNKPVAIIVLNFPILINKFVLLKKDNFTQYNMVVINKIANTIFDKKF
jgi:hypothetical protein